VLGIVVLAIGLVAVGVAVVFNSLPGDAPGPARQLGGATPTSARSTPSGVAVGEQDVGPETGATPTTSVGGPAEPGGAPGLSPPAGGGSSPLFNPSPPVVEPCCVPSPPGGAEPGPGPAAPPASSGGRPAATAGSPEERAVAEALGRLTTDEERVGQLLMLAWIGSTAEEARPALQDLRAGGIVFVQNTASANEARAINQRLQQIARDANLLEPLIAVDHEGGLVQRIKDVPNLGGNWEFAAGGPTDAQACERGLRHAQTLRSLGFSMNLAPVLDVNNNPANPVIGRRSYSDDPHVVARLGAAYVTGLQSGGIAAVGKHFPGHGNTSVDSHLGLPSLPQTIEELERVELVPFKAAVEAGVAGIMSAHIVFPAVDPSGDPATLSWSVMTGLLRHRLGFSGLAVSDDLGAMKAITDNYAPGDAAVRAVLAGVDLLIISAELPRQQQARDALLQAVRDGRIPPERLDQALHNVLTVKARYGLLGTPAQTGGICP
jgi:beta-N-acetylhexosaminidase